jgi:hypothetical protein
MRRFKISEGMRKRNAQGLGSRVSRFFVRGATKAGTTVQRGLRRHSGIQGCRAINSST